CIVLSKSQEASAEEIKGTVEHLNRALESVKCKRRFTEKEVLNKDWEQFTDEDFQKIFNSGYVMEDFEKQCFDEKEGFQSLYFMELKISEAQLERAAHQILDDPECGDVFRIKGFVKLEDSAAEEGNGTTGADSVPVVAADNTWLELNATRKEFSLKPISVGQEVVIVIGENMNEARIREYLGAE
ncbi:GTP-binding protein, partial [Blautia glucerasea]|nr:GTP-binding protein [Blautia glucerasea]